MIQHFINKKNKIKKNEFIFEYYNKQYNSNNSNNNNIDTDDDDTNDDFTDDEQEQQQQQHSPLQRLIFNIDDLKTTNYSNTTDDPDDDDDDDPDNLNDEPTTSTSTEYENSIPLHSINYNEAINGKVSLLQKFIMIYTCLCCHMSTSSTNSMMSYTNKNTPYVTNTIQDNNILYFNYE